MVHDMNHVVSDNHSAVWTVLSNDDAKLAQKKEDELYLSYYSDSDDFVCVRCDDGMSSMAVLKSYFRFRLAIVSCLALLQSKFAVLGTACKTFKRKTIAYASMLLSLLLLLRFQT
jgi:hypothetical protein